MPVGTLPKPAKKIWEKTYNASIANGDSKEVAARKAWTSVKSAGYVKKDGKWTKKSDLIQSFSMYIHRASLGEDGVMRWAATNSDTDPDLYEERMSLELYKDFIGRVQRGEGVPEEFKQFTCSDFWCGGMPYLSVSHYPDLNGHAVPGEPIEVYIDGNDEKARLKAKGILFNSPLGNSVYRSLKEDKNKSPENKIRISIGFLDLAHRHGNGEMWVRDSLYSVCSECLEGVGEKVYLKGYLVHLALTRVPVNKRTEMVLEEKSDMAKKKITRKDDAASIVGKDLAEEIDAKNRVAAQKSDVLIEMSETEEETQELIQEIESQEEETEEAPEPVAEEVPEVVASTTDARGYTEVENPEPKVEKMDASYLPYGGATSMKDAEDAKKAADEMVHVMDLWGMFSQVAWNIIEREDVVDKKSAFTKAVDEFKSMLTAKAMVQFGITERSEVAELAEENPHELKPALDALLSAVDNSLELEGDINSRLQYVNPSLQELGQAITDFVTKSVSAEEPPAPNKDNLLDDIKALIQPLTQSVEQLKGEVGVLKAQNVQPKPRIPQPRSVQLPPTLVAKSEDEPKPGSLKDIMRKSVGIQ